MKSKLHITKKQIVIFVLLLILLIISIITISRKSNKSQEVIKEESMNDYIVTESFTEKSGEVAKSYESRYYSGEKKTYLILREEKNVRTDTVLNEIETDFTREISGLILSSTYNVEFDTLEKYADASGFIYKCRIEESREFLSNEALSGKVRFLHEAPSYFECYIEKKDGSIMRGLLLYDADMKKGTLIYRQCNSDINIPTVFDMVTIVETGD
ncbi:hypothetical protein R2R35_04960 [Anaerocolumna sp. AGMB13020]|uniref:hypothetical protein n=1 Tax=Anaerocolumna sp. AGMB13020 TaxID=3081750 RepID=UPI00295448C8|nr:hypothetical protein [Anaerocolumna sp. AGMB13020]WOO37854.1 hypothetical protein R2R35_04960 [Anaerocolumna sp. AGMB13020]